jgi:RNA-directed DNA polymerase
VLYQSSPLPDSRKTTCMRLSRWRTIEDEVRRLQTRIVKALQAGRWNKVKALQHLLILTRSANAKLLAVRRVTGNDGRRTPGVDNELWETPQRKSQLSHG